MEGKLVEMIGASVRENKGKRNEGLESRGN